MTSTHTNLAGWAVRLSGFEGLLRVFAGGITGATDVTDPAVAAARRAIFSAIEDDLQM